MTRYRVQHFKLDPTNNKKSGIFVFVTQKTNTKQRIVREKWVLVSCRIERNMILLEIFLLFWKQQEIYSWLRKKSVDPLIFYSPSLMNIWISIYICIRISVLNILKEKCWPNDNPFTFTKEYMKICVCLYMVLGEYV